MTERSDPRVARRGVQLSERGARSQLPGEGMLARTRPDEEHLHAASLVTGSRASRTTRTPARRDHPHLEAAKRRDGQTPAQPGAVGAELPLWCTSRALPVSWGSLATSGQAGLTRSGAAKPNCACGARHERCLIVACTNGSGCASARGSARVVASVVCSLSLRSRRADRPVSPGAELPSRTALVVHVTSVPDRGMHHKRVGVRVGLQGRGGPARRAPGRRGWISG